jgi:hypothetical protein
MTHSPTRSARTGAGSTAGSTAASAALAAGTSAGAAARAAGTTLGRAGTALEQRSATAAPAVGAAVGSAVDTVGHVAGALTETVSGLLEEPGVRVGAAVEALRGGRVGPPLAVRRWPWAVGAAVAGAALGAAAAWLIQRLQGTEAPDAQEPHELRAVVDRPGTGTTPSPAEAAGATMDGLPVPGASPTV